jgi:hypothetical protein
MFDHFPEQSGPVLVWAVLLAEVPGVTIPIREVSLGRWPFSFLVRVRHIALKSRNAARVNEASYRIVRSGCLADILYIILREENDEPSMAQQLHTLNSPTEGSWSLTTSSSAAQVLR